ncbi:hypothetical protein M8818_002106 [Zalaria obscura]|uniref:Uncharacterized protein n=1 Tax=Zalaria obscura TaxID=2024903 RepID=A0ACC3SHW9_9PEZI
MQQKRINQFVLHPGPRDMADKGGPVAFAYIHRIHRTPRQLVVYTLQIKRAQGEAANSHRTLRTVQDARLQGSHVISASLHGIHSCAVSIATTKHPPSRNYRLPRVSRAVANANDQSRGRGQLIGLPSAAIALGPGPSFGLRNAKPRLPEALPFGRGTVEEAVRRAETGDPCYTGVKSLVNGSNLCLANSRVFQPARQNLHIS